MVAGPELEPCAVEVLSARALAVLARQDAAMYDQHLRLMRFDEALADLASRRGLLVRFHVKSMGPLNGQAELVVEAPEYMTVEYLKRRVVKAKLQRGDRLLSTARFMLRKRLSGSSSGGEAASGTEELPCVTPAGEEVFLFHLGYRAPGPYQIFIGTAAQTSDREQQEAMRESLLTDAHNRQQQRQQHHAAAAAAAMAAQPAEVVHARLRYQALLEAPGSVSAVQPVQPQRERLLPEAQQSVSPADSQGNSRSLPLASMQAAEGAGSVAPDVPPQPAVYVESRRQLARWTPGEVAALIAGVQMHGTHWSAIHEVYTPTGCINPARTQGDLKDKWRNIVRVVCMGRQDRSHGLTDEQRQIVWSIANPSNDVPE
ncbi:hypothetical protein D9Q98_010042 [Chlorella vulgaris]|uniref:Myb-like domain-containing protein n=1 Tax=Chlorella vulgaris TaxID=3077 RepID=A0A9D4YW80_CHLVU|nr:hypothetical protein D9Q98_010042 [Chlorella vulgaris]